MNPLPEQLCSDLNAALPVVVPSLVAQPLGACIRCDMTVISKGNSISGLVVRYDALAEGLQQQLSERGCDGKVPKATVYVSASSAVDNKGNINWEVAGKLVRHTGLVFEAPAGFVASSAASQEQELIQLLTVSINITAHSAAV